MSVIARIKHELKSELDKHIKEFNRVKSGRLAHSACPRSRKSTCKPLARARVHTDVGHDIRILWTGWQQDTQWLSCLIGDAFRTQRNVRAKAIEQSSYPSWFVKTFGTWDEQLSAFSQLYQRRTGLPPRASEIRQLIAMRKSLWDHLSSRWASDKRFVRTLVVLPTRGFNPKGTLASIELKQLNPRTKVCFVVYDCDTQQLTLLEDEEIIGKHRGATMYITLQDSKFISIKEGLKLFKEWQKRQ